MNKKQTRCEIGPCRVNTLQPSFPWFLGCTGRTVETCTWARIPENIKNYKNYNFIKKMM